MCKDSFIIVVVAMLPYSAIYMISVMMRSHSVSVTLDVALGS